MKKFLLSVLLRAGMLCVFLPIAAYPAAQPELTDLRAVTDYHPKIPLRVYTSDGVLIGEFGDERRYFVAIKDIPLIQRQALLAIEDARFYEHGGVDFKGVARAVLADLTGGYKQGASTITMQVARDFYLSKEKVMSRKLAEVMLAYKIERALTKDQILELYMNQVYLGQRAYGFAAAARTYFGKPLKDVTLAQAAMLAGLPQAPSTVNPVVNPKRAKARQHLVLKRMLDLGYITSAQFHQAENEDLHVRMDSQTYSSHAQYVAEMVRQVIAAQFHDETYTRGISVTTTLVNADQEAAYAALRRNVQDFDQRRGYRGPEAFIVLPRKASERTKLIEETLAHHPASGRMVAAVVTSVTARSVAAQLANGTTVEISGEGLRWVAPALSPRAVAAMRIRPGAVIRVEQQGTSSRWNITEMPNVGAALVALDNQTGAYRALVGGFDFNASNFNHATLAWRQPGSAMKPFIYAAALEKGYSPGTLVNDAPLTLDSSETGGEPWTPQNDDGVYDGPITLRQALAQSKNVDAVRLLRAITPQYAHDYAARFGLDPARQPVNYTLALGTGAVTPVQMASAYSVFANGGYRITPYLIQKVVDSKGEVLFEAKPPAVAQDADRVIDVRNAFIMDSMLHQVTVTGTAAAASQALGRTDIAGKTGTSSQAVDGWFAGYSGPITAVAWMGYDEPQSLGSNEFGATLALPIWIDYMRTALHGRAMISMPQPPGVSMVGGDWIYDEFATSAAPAIDLNPPAPARELSNY